VISSNGFSCIKATSAFLVRTTRRSVLGGELNTFWDGRRPFVRLRAGFFDFALTLSALAFTVDVMTDDRKSGFALMLAVGGLLIIMMFHPTGGRSTAGEFDSTVRRNMIVHSLALACIPLLFLGTLGIYRRLAAPDRLSLSALVLYAFAMVAVMNAAVANGFSGSYLWQKLHTADAASPQSSMSSDVLRALSGYNFSVNQAFALVFVVASSAAILLWSIETLRKGSFPRALGVYGCVVGAFGALGVLTGHSMSTVHGFGGLAMLSQGVWYIGAGVSLLKSKTAV
jgi:hypothetical protein